MLRLKNFIVYFVSWSWGPVSARGMDAIVGRLRTMTDERLRDSMLAAGLKCGPITSSTRDTYEKMLAKALMQREGVAFDGSEKGDHPAVDEDSTRLPQETGGRHKSSGMDAEGGESTADMHPNGEKPTETMLVFYGICPQRQVDASAEEKIHVFVDLKMALKAMAAMKGARLKSFPTRQGAEAFSKGTSGPPPERGTSLDSVEKASNGFPSPRIQDLTSMGKAVKDGNQKDVVDLWENPRYLIGSGDNPTVVKLGCRYNVLHMAAIHDRPGVIHALLNTLDNPEFMRRMYPGDQESVLQQRIRYVVDLYLNTPDATNNDTPLHLACKFGCPEVVDLLCAHPATNTQPRNKYDQRPCDVICVRRNHTSEEITHQIKKYLEDRFYLHLLRATDNSVPPVITLTRSARSRPLDFRWGGRPIDHSLELTAYVGPLSLSKAEEFYKLWKNPPRSQTEKPVKDFHAVLRSDPDRGMEYVGREMAHKMGHRWAEYWHFLDCFVDLSTKDGLDRLEGYLEERERRRIMAHHNTMEAAASTAKGHSSPSTTEGSLLEVLQQLENLSISVDDHDEADDAEDKLATSGPVSREREVPPSSTAEGTASLECVLRNFQNLSIAPDNRQAADGAVDNLDTAESEVDLDPEDRCLSSSRPSFFFAHPRSQVCDPVSAREEGLDLTSGLQGTPWWTRSSAVQQKTEDDDVSSTSSEEYLSADEELVDRQCREHKKEDTGLLSYHLPTEALAQGPETEVLFIEGGDFPTRLDHHVLTAVDNVQVRVERYPLVSMWRNAIRKYPTHTKT